MLPRGPCLLLYIVDTTLFSLISIWLIVNIWYLNTEPTNIDSTIYVVQVIKAGIIKKAIVHSFLYLRCREKIDIT